MKLKINKACDLNSISVLPPHSRRSSIMAQPRSQASQQSFSQGVSSQHNGMFSQISQSSLDETLTDNQRFGSQEKDNFAKRASCLGPISYPREESQMPMSRSSSNLTRRWSSAPVADHKCQLSDELEHRISMMETSLNRFGMVLDSVQTDIMQANKGTKELSLEVEGIRQKSTVHDDSLRSLNRGQEDIKASLDIGFKTIGDQLSKLTQQDKLEQILSELFSLPERIDSNAEKWSNELSQSLAGDLQEINCSLKSLNQKTMVSAPLLPKVSGAAASPPKLLLRREAERRKVPKQTHFVPKIEMGSWTTVKPEQVTFSTRSTSFCKNVKQRRASTVVREQRAIIELDAESDEDLSCFIVEKELDTHLIDEVNQETARILQLARRKKRKQNSRRFMPLYQKK